MAATSTCTIEVPLIDFRRAVAAVKPHAERAKSGDEISALSRVRFVAAKDELYVVATNGVTAAMAAVEILDDSRKERFAKDDGHFAVDISPVLVSDLRQGLRMQRGDFEEDDQVARLTFTDDDVTVQDVSGLWPGSETKRPTLAYSADYPDVVKILGQAMGAAGEAVKPLTNQGGTFRLFMPAAAQYGRPLQFEASGPSTSRGFIVWCGPRFIGSVSSGHDDDDSLARRQSERRAHIERLGLAPALVDL